MSENNFMKIEPVKTVRVFVFFLHLLFDLGEIRYESAIDHS
jgi:hypothetical protein